MEKIVGIICEYNPFHKGHKLQIDKIRLEHPDATIVAIMSGNVVQRGELAMIDKYKRAEIALSSGVDLVLELPYPYSGSTAEIFAESGVEIAQRVGCTHLYFGTESLSISELEKTADVLLSIECQNEIKNVMRASNLGYIQARQSYLSSLGINLPSGSNDILALEYVKAIKAKKYNVNYSTIKRVGANYNDTEVSEFMSASAIRKHYYQAGEFLSIPENTLDIYKSVHSNQEVIDFKLYEDYLYRYCLLAERRVLDCAFDSCEEIGALIKEKALESIDGKDFFDGLSSKSYTTARTKRAILASIFGVSTFERTPSFSVLLGANKKGREVLSQVDEGFVVLTKLADAKKLTKEQREALEFTIKVDMLHSSLLKNGSKPKKAYDKKPIIR